MAMPQITAAQLRQLSRSAADRIVDGIVANQQAIARGGIDTPLRLCHFMAQISFESANLRVTREFASGQAYEGRRDLGNTRPGDGPRYRGRGLIQTTGRANYCEARDAIRKIDPSVPDFEADPAQLEEFPWALLAGIIYWQRRNINRLADCDDVRAVTKAVNGGLLGLDGRMAYLAKAKTIWPAGGQSDAPAEADMSEPARPLLRRGATGHDVVILQNELRDVGYQIAADGIFGEHTEEAVLDFQDANDLDADGVVGPRTWEALSQQSDAS